MQLGCSNNLCAYTFQYGDGSGTSGFYVSDLLQFDMIVGSSLVPNSTAHCEVGFPRPTPVKAVGDQNDY
ncbi:unnamed protein product [Eruca vesicaria subsp. sativa]|uniref:Xylanase inhibitor N-terminal domain-containing protein n=1 Tax=Eruca vesicaria subsp. sativa TaxID=29727 RepID=A0ABC8LLE1_ERUVS|nr:unnamed protein product [Eruca vesicaria subsp. sativa]